MSFCVLTWLIYCLPMFQPGCIQKAYVPPTTPPQYTRTTPPQHTPSQKTKKKPERERSEPKEVVRAAHKEPLGRCCFLCRQRQRLPALVPDSAPPTKRSLRWKESYRRAGVTVFSVGPTMSSVTYTRLRISHWAVRLAS